jgi:SAM-dependent methyltransferase
MSNLYNSLAEVYEAMYKTFINYEEEFNRYMQLLVKYNCSSVVEIGCGTGNLAGNLADEGFMYTGLDNSADMLAIAKKNNPRCNFLQGAMQNFELGQPAQSAIITGRTISYLLTNKEVSDSLAAISKNLEPPGILCFDFIDANKFIPSITGEMVLHKATVGNKKFSRQSFWSVNLSQSWAFDWLSVFYEEKEDGSFEKIGEDNSTIRAFTKDEIILFLELAGFEIKEINYSRAYAFDTFLVVAQKIC